MLRSYPVLATLPGRWLGAVALLLALLLPGRSWAQAAATIRLEAEDALVYGPTKLTATAGFSGTGYVGDFSQASDSLVFNFPTQASRYDLTIRYTLPTSGARTSTVVLNGVAADKSLPSTGAAFGSVSLGRAVYAAGQNKLVIKANQGYYGIDYIELVPVVTTLVPLVNNRLEAELADLNSVTVATTPTGFSGTGFVTGFTNSDANNVSISFNLPTAGLYQLAVGYTSTFSLKVANVTTNGSKATVSFPQTSASAPFSVAGGGQVLLPAGLNTIVIGGNYGFYGIDYVQLTPTTVALPVKPAKTLVDPLATAGAKALFSYLVDLYGTKVLAGQQDDSYGNGNSEVSYVLATTGKEPAIVSMDLYDYSSAPVAAYGTPTGTTERFLTWAKSGNGRGITSLIWHWRAPADITATNGNGSVDPSGAFYTKNTSFNFAAALADTTSTRYRLLMRDIDLIAVQLKKFQAAGVPVLWRPLHETPGTFFWWGNQGPTAFKQLWQLLYTRLTVRHQLHNLIWVYSINDVPDAAWYPGDAYVDIASADEYQATIDPNVNLSSKWDAMKTLVAPRKLVALSESGSLANPDQIRGYATWWSWFCAWQGTYIRNQQVGFLRSLYNDRDIITKDKLADWQGTALAAKSGAAAVSAGLAVYPNPTSGAMLNLGLRLTAAQEVGVELVNSLGQRVATLRPRLQAGDNQLQLPLAGVAPGIYQVLVRPATGPALSQRVQVL
ncbi:glycosyl hydrolase [Hymenobacter sp. H14-R3]|uniref:glycosyl hydrolase n=1 Tax=Hymenobacter sp. H14-R3 TaxID=3046308 RepID=UPI0024BA455E|nr:glycosyl hydrolase [Hymenobacter sp. H14-R3]MDJ0365327.1 glycosyl hydrolase [Hymenobacter sp. H14-R3]